MHIYAIKTIRLVCFLLLLTNILLIAQSSLEVLAERQANLIRRVEKMESDNLTVRVAKIESDLTRIAERLDRIENWVLGGLVSVIAMLIQKILEWLPKSSRKSSSLLSP